MYDNLKTIIKEIDNIIAHMCKIEGKQEFAKMHYFVENSFGDKIDYIALHFKNGNNIVGEILNFIADDINNIIIESYKEICNDYGWYDKQKFLEQILNKKIMMAEFAHIDETVIEALTAEFNKKRLKSKDKALVIFRPTPLRYYNIALRLRKSFANNLEKVCNQKIYKNGEI